MEAFIGDLLTSVEKSRCQISLTRN